LHNGTVAGTRVLSATPGLRTLWLSQHIYRPSRVVGSARHVRSCHSARVSAPLTAVKQRIASSLHAWSAQGCTPLCGSIFRMVMLSWKQLSHLRRAAENGFFVVMYGSSRCRRESGIACLIQWIRLHNHTTSLIYASTVTTTYISPLKCTASLHTVSPYSYLPTRCNSRHQKRHHRNSI